MPRFLLLSALALATACAEPAPTPSLPVPEGRSDLVELLREDLAVPHHPADGGGRAWIARQRPERLVVGDRARFDLFYEVGPRGIAEGGSVYLQISPFWGWSSPQVSDPAAPGYTTVTTDAAGVELEPAVLDRQLLGIAVRGRSLTAGERVRIIYGDSGAGARVDRFAERETRLWIAVDGDGDGRRRILSASPTVDIGPGPAAQLSARLPSAARPGETVALTLAVLDSYGNAGVAIDATFEVDSGDGLAAPERIELAAGDGGLARVEIEVVGEGVHRLRIAGAKGLEAVTNPMMVTAESPRILWADLHGHSHVSDGTGTPADYFRYARDVAGLDVVALTDHDHWGMEPLATDAETWQEIVDQVAAFHDPGRFVTLLGYEWTNWEWGHRHVLYFADRGEVLSAIDERYATPTRLWEALRGRQALTFAHHSAGGPIATNWNVPPDPELEPVTEIVSVHGSSEAADSPLPIYAPVPGNTVRDVLEAGIRLGLIGSGDSHDGHPGLAHLASPSGGVAAILSEDLSREGVLEALRARRVYATNGPRIVLRLAVEGRRMGSSQPAGGDRSLIGLVVTEGPLDRVDVVRNGGRLDSLDGEGRTFFSFRHTLDGTRPGDWAYVRAVQTDGGAAWSSPFFFADEP
ncbi:MAG: CehA/McbA family metallohydrolase [Thermoanaerobaculia bacterium]|nr:CehA/McbA family metallohydrolase [Thermoanaerobaculia bacterium]